MSRSRERIPFADAHTNTSVSDGFDGTGARRVVEEFTDFGNDYNSRGAPAGQRQ